MYFDQQGYCCGCLCETPQQRPYLLIFGTSYFRTRTCTTQHFFLLRSIVLIILVTITFGRPSYRTRTRIPYLSKEASSKDLFFMYSRYRIPQHVRHREYVLRVCLFCIYRRKAWVQTCSGVFVHSRIFLAQYIRRKPCILPPCTISLCAAFQRSSCVLPANTQNVHWMFTECSLNVHWMFTECASCRRAPSPSAPHSKGRRACYLPTHKVLLLIIF